MMWRPQKSLPLNRGHAKQQAQEKNAAKQASMKKAGSQLDAQKAGLKFQCPSCLQESTNYKMLQQHYDSKHPKLTIPPEDECYKK